MIGLPSLQAIDRAQGARIWMGSEATDMRYGFDRLAERVKTVIGENPQSGHLFVFRSRRGDWLKILVWDRDGFVSWYLGQLGQQLPPARDGSATLLYATADEPSPVAGKRPRCLAYRSLEASSRRQVRGFGNTPLDS